MGVDRFTLVLEGSPYEIERRDEILTVNGVEYSCFLKAGQVVVAGTPHTVKLSGSGAEVDGVAYAFEAKGLGDQKAASVKKKAGASAGEAKAGAIKAIMPGLIIDILKKEGDSVRAGETVLVLEAMKMQNEIAARAPGTLRQLNVKVGDNVEMHQVLCVVE